MIGKFWNLSFKNKSIILASFTGLLLILLLIFFPEQKVDFNTEVRPILNDNCLACHGGVKKSGGFSLLFEEEAKDTTKSGKYAIVPGRPGKSEMIRRLTSTDPEERMPPESDPLPEEQIELLKKWIDQGAEWDLHWAYEPPEPIEPPQIAKQEWASNKIDAFIAKKHQSRQLQANPPEDPGTLMRRLSLDLTGLPPQRELVGKYLDDPSEQNYEQVVDLLLDQKSYGERWSAMWLDLARYADSKGYERDDHRVMWKYRDWVVKAFNEDMPFDEFTIKQLAGDLLPLKQQDLLATAFHRNTMNNDEGGTDDEEFRVAAILDRVNTTWNVWLGTTMECVQCHSHPYDPFRQQEYYETYAFFNQSLDNDLKSEYPHLESYEPEEEQKIIKIVDYLRKHDQMVNTNTDQWLQDQIKDALFPRLIPGDCDDFQSVTIYPDRTVSNWTNNVQSATSKQFYFIFNDINLSGVESLDLTYATPGNDCRIEVRLDSVTGKLWSSIPLSKTGRIRGNEGGSGDSWKTINQDVEQVTGEHNLYFIFVNTTGEVPEGIANLKEIKLNYEGAKASNQFYAYKDSLINLRKTAVRTPVTKDRTPGNKRPTHVFERGSWMSWGDAVDPDLPGVLVENDRFENRLDLARWIVDPENPLTARVAVNRFWEQLFGLGLVATLEDFGSQGEAPSHPELLDWLALTFVHEDQWSMKKLIRRMVMSATYRQSSKIDPGKLEKDPSNKWLARGPRFRLKAEMVRDQALSVSGLLSEKMFGPSVMPPQPEGIWQVVYSGRKWEESTGEDKYRRAIYTYWRRTTPYPSLLSFDMPSREVCVNRRIRTNTPIQSLVTLNDPVFFEAAQSLAQKIADRKEKDVSGKIAGIYDEIFLEQPDSSVVATLKTLYQDSFQHYQEKPESLFIEAAAKENELVELASYTIVANALMNLDKFLTKE